MPETLYMKVVGCGLS